MTRNELHSILLSAFALAASLTGPNPAPAQEAKQQYATMAPLEQYLMDRNAEIALARSAAPESISRDAEVLVLGRHGFETAVKSKNGFVCIVERLWTSAADPDFWNPKVRTPICFNTAAARSMLLRNVMSKQGYGGDSVEHWLPHLMFHFSQTDRATWGADLPSSLIFTMSNSLPGRGLSLKRLHCADFDPYAPSVLSPVSIPKFPNIRTTTPAASK